MEELIPISFIAGIVLAWYFFLKMRNKERMALIEKGVEISEFIKYRFPWLKIGIIIFGAGIGVFAAIFLQSHPVRRYILVDSESVFLMSILIFGGIAMIVAAIIDRLIDKKQNG